MNVEATLSGQGLTDEKTNLLLQNYKLPSIKDKRNINKTEIGNNNVENKDKKQPK